jgi:hypothetical protein
MLANTDSLSTESYGALRIHFYSIEITNLPRVYDRTVSNKVAKEIEAISSIGYCFPQQLPQRICESEYCIFLQNSDRRQKSTKEELEVDDDELCLKFRYNLLFEKLVLPDEMVTLQYFHHMLCNIQIFSGLTDQLSNFNTGLVEQLLSSEQKTLFSDWKALNGTTYILCPLLPSHFATERYSIAHLEESIVQLHQLIYNMVAIRDNNINRRSVSYWNKDQTTTDLQHKVTTTNGRNLVAFGDTESQLKDRLTLTDILLTKKKGASQPSCPQETNPVPEEEESVTFAQYFLNKPGLSEPARSFIEEASCSEAISSLTTGYQLSGKLVLINILKAKDRSQQQALAGLSKTSSATVHILPQLCQVIGHSKHYYMMLLVPSLCHRLESVAASYQLYESCFRPIHNRDDNMPCSRNFIANTLIAITPRRNMEGISSERFEFLGDAFLKFATSLSKCNPFAVLIKELI